MRVCSKWNLTVVYKDYEKNEIIWFDPQKKEFLGIGKEILTDAILIRRKEKHFDVFRYCTFVVGQGKRCLCPNC